MSAHQTAVLWMFGAAYVLVGVILVARFVAAQLTGLAEGWRHDAPSGRAFTVVAVVLTAVIGAVLWPLAFDLLTEPAPAVYHDDE